MNGISRHHVSPNGLGKFEGEPCYAGHFYDAAMEGCGDDFYDGDTLVSAFTIDADDVAKFPCCLNADDVGKVVLCWESDQGFWNTALHTAEEAARIEAECEADAETVEEED